MEQGKFIQIITLFALWNVFSRAYCDQWTTIGERLSRIGFEGVKLSQVAQTLQIEYENRIFINQVYAAGVVLSVAVKEIDEPLTVVLIPHIRGMKIGSLRIESSKFQQFIDKKISQRDFIGSIEWDDAIQNAEGYISSFNAARQWPQLDFYLYPSVVLQLGNYDDPYKFTWNAEAAVDVKLWHGAFFYSNVTIPIFDEIATYAMEPRLSRCSFNQLFHIHKTTWGNVAAGVFYPDRWGVAAQIGGFVSKRRLFWGTQVEYTGFFLQQKNLVHYSRLNAVTSKIFFNYYPPYFNLKLGCGYYKYLQGDYGPFIELARKFGDLDIGFFAAATNIDQFGGVVFHIPIPPKKRFKPKLVRFNWPFYYRFRFQSTSETQTVGEPLQSGQRVQTGFDMCDEIEEFNLSYIKNNIFLWYNAFQYVKTMN